MEYVVEESADCACVGHLLLSGVLLGVCSCAVEEHAGALWEGHGATVPHLLYTHSSYNAYSKGP